MLWITGSVLFIGWLIGKFLLHKSGMFHLFLMAAVVLFAIQLAQDLRTREYERSLDS